MAVRERRITQEELDDWREDDAPRRYAPPPKAREEVPAPRSRTLELGVMALAFGLPMWWFAATNTLVGIIRFFDLVLSRIGVPVQIPMPTGWWALIAVAVGWVYSRSEITHVPWRRTAKGWAFRGVWALLTWVIVISTDVGAQYLGTTTVTATAWPLEQWVASTVWAAALWSVILTFIPDRMILWGAQQTGLSWLLARMGIH